MKVILQRAAIVPCLQLLQGVVPTRTPKPISQAVLLKTDRIDDIDYLRMRSTDFEVALEILSPAVAIEEPGALAVPAARIADILSLDRADAVTLESAPDKCRLSSPDGDAELFCYGAEEFPAVSLEAFEPQVTIPGPVFKDLMIRSEFCIDRAPNKYVVCGLLVESSGTEVRCIAANGSRMAVAKHRIKGMSGRAIVPPKAYQLLIRMLTDADDLVDFRMTTDAILARIYTEHGGTRAIFRSSLVEGQFPDYASVLTNAKSSADKTIKAEKAGLIHALQRARLFTNEESKAVTFETGADRVAIKASASEVGTSTIVLPVKYEGPEMTFGFNAQMLLECVKAVQNDVVIIKFNTPRKPFVISGEAECEYVMMPVTLDAKEVRP